MKIFKTFIWVFTSILLLVFSCAKDKIEKNANSDELGIGLTVDIGGISDEFETLALTHNSVQTQKDESPDLAKLVSLNDFDAVPTIADLKPNASAKLTKSANNKIASQTPMSNGIKYYLVLFDDDNGARGNFKSSHLLTAGVRKTINVQVGKKYHWMAYSYNSEVDDLPTVSASNFNVSMGENKDFLYAFGVTDIISETSPTILSVVFNRMLTRVGIEINAQGMFTDDIKTLDANLILRKGDADQPFNIANFNLLNQEITESNTSYSTNNFKLFSISKNIPVAYSDKSNKVITYLNIPPYVKDNLNIGVRLNKLEIELDEEAKALGNSYRVFDYLALTEQNRPVIYSENINILSSGKQKLLKIDLVESPLISTVTGKAYRLLQSSLEVPFTVKWARSNIYRHSDGSYRFNHVNKHYDNRNSYFSWGSADPTSYGSNQDPCKLVYPQGLWVTPTVVDFATLTGDIVSDKALLGLIELNFPIVTELLGGLGLLSSVNFEEIKVDPVEMTTDRWFVEYGTIKDSNNASTNPYLVNGHTDPNTNLKLKFYYNGYSIKTDLVNGLIPLNLGSTFGKSLRLWSSDPSINLLGLASVATKELDGDTKDVDLSTALLNVSLLSALNVVESNSNNIRCVRNNQYTRKNNN